MSYPTDEHESHEAAPATVTVVPIPQPRGSSVPQIVKVLVLGLSSLLLIVATIFCVLKVGDLNSHAAAIQACLDTPNAAGCPNKPASAAQVASLRNTAKTIGSLGWLFIFMLLWSVGGSFMDSLRRR